MTHYLIEFRFFGKAKQEMKQLIYDVTHKFHLRHKRAIPHISLAGPFFTNSESRLVQDFKRICSESALMSFQIDGFGVFKDNRVVFIRIKPSEKLDAFRWRLSKTIQPYCTLKPHDYKESFEYHATMAMKLDYNRFNRIKDYVARIKQPKYEHFMIRATLLKNSRILCEYDFLQRRALGRGEAKSRKEFNKSMGLLKNFFEGTYNPNRNVKITSAIQRKEDGQEHIKGVSDSKRIQEEQNKIIAPKKSMLQSIRDYFNPPRTFLISDLHLDHTNIIRFCKRPFHNVDRMNTVIVNNWNRTVRKKDTVYFLGDMSFGKGSRPADYWLSKLNGNVFFIRGFSIKPSGERNQHDRISRKENVFDNLIIDYKDKRFFLVHDPDQVPLDWKEWAICGHHHNNKPVEFPFINGKNKRINVSVELINYQPLDIDKLFELDFENIDNMETINSQPKKKNRPLELESERVKSIEIRTGESKKKKDVWGGWDW